jgi:hypothetical protein
MEVKQNEKVKAAVEINGQVIINMENSQVFETINKEEAFFYISSVPDPSTGEVNSVKIRFLKK